MTTKLVVKGLSDEMYVAMVEELDALKTEEAFDMGLRHVQWAHVWGQKIRDYVPTEVGMEKTLTRLSVDVGRSVRTLYRYVALFDQYPDLQVAINQHGKSISVNKILGPAGEDAEEKPECDHSCARHCK